MFGNGSGILSSEDSWVPWNQTFLHEDYEGGFISFHDWLAPVDSVMISTNSHLVSISKFIEKKDEIQKI